MKAPGFAGGWLLYSGRIVSAVLVVFAAGGCLYIPTDFHDSYTRENIEDFALESIVVGKTTKEEILLQLGEPDGVASDSRIYEYHWEKIKGVLIVGGMPAGYPAGAWSKRV